MLTTTLVVPAAKNDELPESNNQTQASPVLVISITNDKIIYVEDQSYTITELEPVLQRMLDQYEGSPTIRLNADRALVMEEVFSILNIAKRNRYRVILGTKPVS